MSSTENLYSKFSASELSAIILKGGSPTSNDRDAGFCSGSSEGGDDLSIDHSRLEPRSPTDASEDSVEVKVTPISSFPRNKRKSTEPSRVICEQESGPLKKRIRYTTGENNSDIDCAAVGSAVGVDGDINGIGGVDISISGNLGANSDSGCGIDRDRNHSSTVSKVDCKNHFRPWSRNNNNHEIPHENMPNPAEILIRHPGVTTLHRSPIDYDDIQEEPLALVTKKSLNCSRETLTNAVEKRSPSKSNGSNKIKEAATIYHQQHYEENDLDGSIHSNSGSDVGDGRDCNSSTSVAGDLELSLSSVHGNRLPNAICISTSSCNSSNSSSTSQQNQQQQQHRPQQRNYKNMTRERRIEANARERTRVHTISAAYDTLRRSIPSYSHTQKLSKLSVLRVACSYILTLSRMAGHDYSEDQSSPSLASCFELVTKTIQTEGKIRKKKDE